MSEKKFYNQYSISTKKVKTKSNQAFLDLKQRQNFRNDVKMLVQAISLMLVKTTTTQTISLPASSHWNDSWQPLKFACKPNVVYL